MAVSWHPWETPSESSSSELAAVAFSAIVWPFFFLGIWPVALVLGFAGAEVVTGVADWFTDHHERLRHLSAQLEAIKETVALVRVSVPDVSGDRNEARVEAQEVAMNLLDIAKSIQNGDF